MRSLPWGRTGGGSFRVLPYFRCGARLRRRSVTVRLLVTVTNRHGPAADPTPTQPSSEKACGEPSDPPKKQTRQKKDLGQASCLKICLDLLLDSSVRPSGYLPIAVTGNCIRETKQQQAPTTPAEQATPVGGF